MSEEFTDPPEVAALRVKAIESVLVEKGVIADGAIDELVDLFENKLGPKNGAKVVAKAWTDPEYKKRLLSNATAAIAELGFSGFQGDHMVVLENTAQIHHVVVCTLCSCYPWPVLGLPPKWYKSPAYRSRVVLEPRAVIKEFGLDIPDHVEVRVYDSNSELRYLVLPERPAGTAGWDAEALERIVTRDSMIGTGICQAATAVEDAR